MNLTNYHAKLAAFDLIRQASAQSLERISTSLFDARVDLNPHQIDAALFTLQNPLSKGVILADEVGLGKTIEAGLVLCQLWAEKRRRLAVVCPASLRKQWACELGEKFHLPCRILDKRALEEDRETGMVNPFEQEAVIILSYPFAARMEQMLSGTRWDWVVFDEAHKLRNAHRESHKTGQALKSAFAGSKKMLLTATPLQNSLLEIFGLTSLIDEEIFGDAASFRRAYLRSDADLTDLKTKLAGFCKRTLRKDVQEYVNYTARKAITQPFTPGDDEAELYRLVSEFLMEEESFSLPHTHRHLILLVARKLLASSSAAITLTLSKMRDRLIRLQQGGRLPESLLEEITLDDDLETDYLEQANSVMEPEVSYGAHPQKPNALTIEIRRLQSFIDRAQSIQEDGKSRALLTALHTGFFEMARMGAQKKAVIFTESRRTQEYLRDFLIRQGWGDKLATFNGTNTDEYSNLIYSHWKEKHQGTGRCTGSRAIDQRTAIIDFFREEGEILIATEAAGEGINLQFCSLVINYDLPWNPQRVEQRIGRCHRYGQKHDVVVVNFLNRSNEADQRVLSLLTEKFKLFDGVFGASDEILGRIESGLDFEKRILDIYQHCRSSEEIQQGFQQLQEELEKDIAQKMDQTQSLIFEHFDQQVHDRLAVRKGQTDRLLDRVKRRFWNLTSHVLTPWAEFDHEAYHFDLLRPPLPQLAAGRYELARDKDQNFEGIEYRLGHPLGEFALNLGMSLPTPPSHLCFDLSNHEVKLSLLNSYLGQRGQLLALFVEVESLEKEQLILLSAQMESGQEMEQEALGLLFDCGGTAQPNLEEALVDQEAWPRMEALLLEQAKQESETRNFRYYKQERQKLESWASERIRGVDLELEDIAKEINSLRKQSQQSQNMQEEEAIQEQLAAAEKRQNSLKRNSLLIEGQIIEQRDDLLESLKKRMTQQLKITPLFRVSFEIT